MIIIELLVPSVAHVTRSYGVCRANPALVFSAVRLRLFLCMEAVRYIVIGSDRLLTGQLFRILGLNGNTYYVNTVGGGSCDQNI
jgi:hypothetical protein